MIRSICVAIAIALFAVPASAGQLMSAGGPVTSTAGFPVIVGGTIVENSADVSVHVTPAVAADTEVADGLADFENSKLARGIKKLSKFLHRPQIYTAAVSAAKHILEHKFGLDTPGKKAKFTRVRNGNADPSGNRGGKDNGGAGPGGNRL